MLASRGRRGGCCVSCWPAADHKRIGPLTVGRAVSGTARSESAMPPSTSAPRLADDPRPPIIGLFIRAPAYFAQCPRESAQTIRRRAADADRQAAGRSLQTARHRIICDSLRCRRASSAGRGLHQASATGSAPSAAGPSVAPRRRPKIAPRSPALEAPYEAASMQGSASTSSAISAMMQTLKTASKSAVISPLARAMSGAESVTTQAAYAQCRRPNAAYSPSRGTPGHRSPRADKKPTRRRRKSGQGRRRFRARSR